MVKKLPSMQETQVQSLGWEDPLEKGKTTHSSFLDWRIPWTEKPGRLQSMGLKELDRTELITLFHGVAMSQTQLNDFIFTFHFHSLEKEMATHSSVLAWRIPGMAEHGGLPSMGSYRVGHD